MIAAAPGAQQTPDLTIPKKIPALVTREKYPNKGEAPKNCPSVSGAEPETSIEPLETSLKVSLTQLNLDIRKSNEERDKMESAASAKEAPGIHSYGILFFPNTY